MGNIFNWVGWEELAKIFVVEEGWGKWSPGC